MPALITKKGIINCSYHVVVALKSKIKQVITLRIAYSLLCWIVGIIAFYAAMHFLAHNTELNNALDSKTLSKGRELMLFYSWVGVPMLAAVGVVMVILRPIYIISVFDIYCDYLTESGEEVSFHKTSKSSATVIIFLIFATVALSILLYKEQLKSLIL